MWSRMSTLWPAATDNAALLSGDPVLDCLPLFRLVIALFYKPISATPSCWNWCRLLSKETKDIVCELSRVGRIHPKGTQTTSVPLKGGRHVLCCVSPSMTPIGKSAEHMHPRQPIRPVSLPQCSLTTTHGCRPW